MSGVRLTWPVAVISSNVPSGWIAGVAACASAGVAAAQAASVTREKIRRIDCKAPVKITCCDELWQSFDQPGMNGPSLNSATSTGHLRGHLSAVIYSDNTAPR